MDVAHFWGDVLRNTDFCSLLDWNLQKEIRKFVLGENSLVRLFVYIIKPFTGLGLERIPLVSKVYQFVTKRLFKNSITLVEVHGQKMYVDAAFGITLKASGTYLSERLMTEIFMEQLKEGMTVVDVGAHVGYYTLLAAKKVGKVFAFEPEPSSFDLLVRNIGINGHHNVVAIKKAVMGKSWDVGLYVNDVSGSHSIVNKKEHQKSITVEAITLDEYFTNRNIDVIKVDVEGAEIPVLEGTSNILSGNAKLFIEFAPEAIMKAGFTPSEFLDILYGHGFKIQVINEASHTLEPITKVLEICKETGYVNLFCHKE